MVILFCRLDVCARECCPNNVQSAVYDAIKSALTTVKVAGFNCGSAAEDKDFRPVIMDLCSQYSRWLFQKHPQPISVSTNALWDEALDEDIYDEKIPKGMIYEKGSCAGDTRNTVLFHGYIQNRLLRDAMRNQWRLVGNLFQQLYRKQITYGKFKHGYLNLFKGSDTQPVQNAQDISPSDFVHGYECYLEPPDDYEIPLFHVFYRVTGCCKCGSISKRYRTGIDIRFHVAHEQQAYAELVVGALTRARKVSEACTDCKSPRSITSRQIEKLPYLLFLETDEGDNISECPDLPVLLQLPEATGDVTKYDFLAIEYDTGDHFLAVINVNNVLYRYDGRHDNGKLAYIAPCPSMISYELMAEYGLQHPICTFVYSRRL